MGYLRSKIKRLDRETRERQQQFKTGQDRRLLDEATSLSRAAAVIGLWNSESDVGQ